MAEYGYAYRSVSTYSTMRNGTREPAVIKPFVPFIPKSDGSNYSEGAVTRKKIVPVTGRPYDEPTMEKYASSEDESDDERYHQTSPVRSSPRKFDDKFPTKVQQNHEGGHNPQRFGPQRPTGTYNGGNKDGHKPIGISPIRNGNYNGTNVYDGDHRPTAVGDPNPPYKEGRKPIGGGRSTHDGYNNGYGGDKEGRKPIGISPIRNDNYDDTNAVGDPNPYKEVRKPIGGGGIRSSHDGYNNGYGDKAGVKPIGINPIRNDKYDGTNGYGSDHRVTDVGDSNPYKEGRKPIGVGSLMSPHDGYNHGKGYGGDKEARKPIGIGSNIKNDNYDGPNRYGGDHRAAAVGDPNPYKEGGKPIGVDSIRSTHDGYNNGYGGDREGRKPIIGNKNENYDIPNGYGNDYNKKEGYKPTRNGNYGNGYGISNRDDKPFGSSSNPKYDDGDNAVNYYNNRSNSNVPKISSNWTAAPRKGTQLSQPIHDIDKAMELLRMEAAKRDQQHSNNDHYYDSPTPGNASPRFTDRTGSGATMRPHGNVNQFPSRPRDSTTRVTFIDDVSDYGDDYYRRDDIGRYGYHDAVIDSREAEKKFRGTRV